MSRYHQFHTSLVIGTQDLDDIGDRINSIPPRLGIKLELGSSNRHTVMVGRDIQRLDDPGSVSRIPRIPVINLSQRQCKSTLTQILCSRTNPRQTLLKLCLGNTVLTNQGTESLRGKLLQRFLDTLQGSVNNTLP